MLKPSSQCSKVCSTLKRGEIFSGKGTFQLWICAIKSQPCKITLSIVQHEEAVNGLVCLMLSVHTFSSENPHTFWWTSSFEDVLKL